MDFYLVSVILFFIILFCWIGYKIIKKQHVETFQTEFEFLDPVSAYQIIEKSGYFNHLNIVNIRARLCKNISNCKFKYQKELMLIDNMEQDGIKWLIQLIKDKFKENNMSQIIFNQQLKFAKFSLELEGNMPHTHIDVIFLPSYFYSEIWALWQKSKNKLNSKTDSVTDSVTDFVITKYGSTIIHELCHIYQRKYKQQFNDFYKNHWYFEQFNIENIDKYENILEINRLNPDGIDISWLWVNPYSETYKHKQEYYLLAAVFNTNEPKFLNDTDSTVYKLDKYMENKYRVAGVEKIKNNTPLQTFFGPISNNYHPNEIAAEYLAIYMLEKMNISPKNDFNDKHEGYIKFSLFVNSIL